MSAEHVLVVLPVYYTQSFKTKPDKTFMVNLNWWRNSHHFIKNEVKVWFTDEILRQLKEQDAKKIEGPYELAIVYHYKTVTSDLDNVCGLGAKHANDAFQKYGLVENDDVRHCKKSAFYVGEKDKDNPRLEVFIRPYTKEDKECTIQCQT
jgi:Holliday junction resolvase RusA-like endonuclease